MASSSYYTITYHGNKFYAQVYSIDDNTTEIIVGGNLTKCVTIHVYDDEKYVYLLEVLYDSFCNLDNNLIKKEGTIIMLHASFALCKYLFPDKTSIHFTDESAIKCIRNNSLPLPEVYMMLYGKTWYQTNFDVTIDKKNEIKLGEIQSVLQKKPGMKWDILWSKFLSITFPHDEKDKIHQHYMKALTWNSFFQSIKNDRCQYWQHWVIPLFNVLSKGFHLRGTEWHMKFPHYHEVMIIPTKNVKQIKPKNTRLQLFGGSTRKYMNH